MQVQDFLPYYPPINENFQTSIVKQKDIYDLATEQTSSDLLRSHQAIIARFMSQHTLYNHILLYHQMGTGKTCASIAAIEHNRQSIYKKAIILTPSNILKSQYKRQILHECMPHKPKSLGFYTFFTFCTFPGYDSARPNEYENCLFVIDEVHKLKDIAHTHRIDIENIAPGTPGGSPDRPITFVFNDKIRFTYKRQSLSFVYNQNVSTVIELTDPTVRKLTLTDIATTDGKLVTTKKDVYINIRRSPYSNLLHTLHNIKQKKVILMTGTPMTDDALEFTNIVNLLNDKDNQITPADFRQVIETGEMPDSIKSLLYGKISYLRAKDDSVDVIYQTNKHPSVKDIPQLTIGPKIFLNLFYTKMGDSQNETYRNIQRQITPQTGFNNQIQLAKVSVADGKITTKNASTHSSKFNTLLEIIDGHDAPYNRHFIYCEFVREGVEKLKDLLIKKYGQSSVIVIQSSPTKKQTIGSSSVASSQTQIAKKLQFFNENTDFKKPKILISSKMISEGITLKNISHVHILTPHWNMAVIDQAIARGIRFKSHELLKNKYPRSRPVVKVYLYAALTFNPESRIQYRKSIDYQKYYKSFEKDIAIKRIEKLIQNIAFDCNLHSFRNTVTGSDYTRDCYYDTCSPPDCLQKININDIQDSELETSSYNVYYAASPEHKNSVLEWLRDNINETNPLFTAGDVTTNPPLQTNVINRILSNIIYSNMIVLQQYVLKETNGVYYLTSFKSQMYTPIHIIQNGSILQLEPGIKNIPIPNIEPARKMTPAEKDRLKLLKKDVSAKNKYGVFIAQPTPPASNILPFVRVGNTSYGISFDKVIYLQKDDTNLYGNLYITKSKSTKGAGTQFAGMPEAASTLAKDLYDSGRLLILE